MPRNGMLTSRLPRAHVSLLILLSPGILLAVGCDKDGAAPTTGASTPATMPSIETAHVIGKVMTAGGQPVEGADIFIAGTTTMDRPVGVSTKTGPDGRFTKAVLPGSYNAWA